MADVTLHVEDVALVGLTVTESDSAALSIGGIAYSPPTYDGGYHVTPNGTAQVLPTAGRVLAEDVTVDPIPSNYGLVTWDGSVLTVS